MGEAEVAAATEVDSLAAAAGVSPRPAALARPAQRAAAAAHAWPVLEAADAPRAEEELHEQRVGEAEVAAAMEADSLAAAAAGASPRPAAAALADLGRAAAWIPSQQAMEPSAEASARQQAKWTWRWPRRRPASLSLAGRALKADRHSRVACQAVERLTAASAWQRLSDLPWARLRRQRAGGRRGRRRRSRRRRRRRGGRQSGPWRRPCRRPASFP